MDIKIEVLDFEREERGFKLGYCDIKVIHSEEKWEIFRNIAVFEKDNKKWVSFPKTKRGEQWVYLYERNPQINKDIYQKILSELQRDYL